MFIWDGISPHKSAPQSNTPLRLAELELSGLQQKLNALLSRYSTDETSRQTRKEMLQKALDRLYSLHTLYSSTQRSYRSQSGDSPSVPGDPAELKRENIVRKGTALLAEFLLERQEHYCASSRPLDDRHLAAMSPFFTAAVLKKVRVWEFAGREIADPPFYSAAANAGLTKLPTLRHMNSLTFVDVIVFPEKITARDLFHGLVHATQFEILGLARYTDLFVRSFVEVERHFLVPLERHTRELEARYAASPSSTFSVEDEVWHWIREGRYAAHRSALD